MPGIDGFTVCRRLKSEYCKAAIPVIFLSAAIETEDKLLRVCCRRCRSYHQALLGAGGAGPGLHPTGSAATAGGIGRPHPQGVVAPSSLKCEQSGRNPPTATLADSVATLYTRSRDQAIQAQRTSALLRDRIEGGHPGRQRPEAPTANGAPRPCRFPAGHEPARLEATSALGGPDRPLGRLGQRQLALNLRLRGRRRGAVRLSRLPLGDSHVLG